MNYCDRYPLTRRSMRDARERSCIDCVRCIRCDILNEFAGVSHSIHLPPTRPADTVTTKNDVMVATINSSILPFSPTKRRRQSYDSMFTIEAANNNKL